MGKKQRRALAEKIANIPAGEVSGASFLHIAATGPFGRTNA